MSDDTITQMADIEKRLLALKALRPVDTSQLQFLSQEWDFTVALAARPNDGWFAQFHIVVVCGGPPIADVGVDGLVYGNSLVTPGVSSSISGNTLTTTITIFNEDTASGYSIAPKIRAFALNGISATCVRTA